LIGTVGLIGLNGFNDHQSSFQDLILSDE